MNKMPGRIKRNTYQQTFQITSTLAVIITLLFISVSASGCNHNVLTPPPASSIAEVPIEVDPLELYNEYVADPNGTMEKYRGKKLFFPYVEVHKMSFLGEPPDTDKFVQMGNVKFRVKYHSQLNNIREGEGYVVEATGTLSGMQWTYLIIEDCWLRVIYPPGGATDLPPEY
ncbi:MAG: hypothetical protein WC231_02150 [Dehalococcoidales bacterium]|jgi:hypothetical protein|nr:hypothetical protein [Dehalococcoidales bacterium]MDX9986939.1 hypothetical protein [Dehalococcoidales bacterium]NLE90450.1 hypothetical protein [Dehalococcoidales bacterium]